MGESTEELTVEQYQKRREYLKKIIELDESLQRLEANPDFKKVFVEYYLKTEPERLVGLLADSQVTTSKDKEFRELIKSNIHEQMIGIARFSEFLRMTVARAEMAKKDLANLEAAEAEYHFKKTYNKD